MKMIHICKAGKIREHKYWEFETRLGYDNWVPVFEVSANITHKTDHAGVKLSFSFLKFFNIELSSYDSRHWNEEEDCWVVYP